jgi:hypothetical protein
MKKEEIEMLIRVDERTADMHKVLFGNGQPGLCKRFDKVENNQQNCINQRKQGWLDVKWLAILIIAGFEVYISFFK